MNRTGFFSRLGAMIAGAAVLPFVQLAPQAEMDVTQIFGTCRVIGDTDPVAPMLEEAVWLEPDHLTTLRYGSAVANLGIAREWPTFEADVKRGAEALTRFDRFDRIVP